MWATDENGVTKREHLEQVGKQRGEMPDEYYGPELPELLESTWLIFLELNSGRQGKTIGFTDIKSYCELTGQTLYNWQLDAIKRLDLVWVRNQRNG